MKTEAIIMLITGLGLLYGGLAWCIGIAWYHSKNIEKQQKRNDISNFD